MAPFIALFFLSALPKPPACGLIRPVAPDVASARRIAEAVLQNVHAPRFPHDSERPVRPYLLKVVPAQDDANAWIAFQDIQWNHHRLPPGSIEVTAGGGGLGFRINRCTGAISRMFFQR
jgi:hypothetical protein